MHTLVRHWDSRGGDSSAQQMLDRTGGEGARQVTGGIQAGVPCRLQWLTPWADLVAREWACGAHGGATMATCQGHGRPLDEHGKHMAGVHSGQPHRTGV